VPHRRRPDLTEGKPTRSRPPARRWSPNRSPATNSATRAKPCVANERRPAELRPPLRGTRISNASALDMTVLIHPLVNPNRAAHRRRSRSGVRHARARARRHALRHLHVRAVDNIADNSSAARYVLGAERSLRALAICAASPLRSSLTASPSRPAKQRRARRSATGISVAHQPPRPRRHHTRPRNDRPNRWLTRAYAVEHATSVKASFGALGDVAIVCSTIRSEPYVDC